jgi:uncharacterized membrane protein
VSDEDRIARLEHRLTVLEGLVRQLVGQERGIPAIPSASPPTSPPPEQVASVRPEPESRPPTRTPPSPRPPAAPSIISEQWLGQRGLLAVGVIFVILAAGYLLKLSFDRGWVSPLVRCVGGAVAGVGVGALGWRLHGKGTRTFGAALIGCGAAIVYLAVWAAARLYEFLPPGPAIGALALVSLGLAAVALAIDVQALGATAALGAFFAPLVVGKEAGSVNLLLVYLGAMGAALGWVAARRRWRIATLVIALAYFGVASSGIVGHADPTGLYLYGILGGAAGLFVGLREGWLECRLLSFSGGWALLWIANEAAVSHWPTVVGGVVLTAPVWWRALTAGTIWSGETEGPGRYSFGDSFYFYASPILLGYALREVAPARLDATPGLVALLIAVPYLAVGLSQIARRPFALVGAVALVVAALNHWSGIEATWALLALVHGWALADHLLKRKDGAWFSMATFAVALWHLVAVDLPGRPPAEPAFIGAWALTLWWSIETAIALALGLLREQEAFGHLGLRPQPLFWGLAGLILLFGVTGELMRAFNLSQLERTTADLAGGLSVSAWWICFAAGCFIAGFRRRVRPLRLAGFLVAGLALGKVLLVDLSTLDALYRVGSAFILGVVSLGVAYAYHRSGVRDGSG